MRAVHRGSAQAVVELMQTPRGTGGNLRVDTGFLRASLVATTGAALPAQTFKPDGVKAFAYDAGPINLVIANADIKDPITAVYTANYARPREYGARGHAADRWVALAAQRWPQVVQQECAKAQASVASRSGV
ncbi:hypothetical protein [Brevundimonas sp. NIBR11]|uniref:hypothetical protein n=1 Tax=Brevundimonas sp. NIBR11 TaxID=3015999 RepID=UPI0022F12C2F|nr:hypothetical protein [Brevundimonas sp. NIBR11]